MIPFAASLKKSKKRRAIALAAFGGCGGLGQLFEPLAELWEGLEDLWTELPSLKSVFLEKLKVKSVLKMSGLLVNVFVTIGP